MFGLRICFVAEFSTVRHTSDELEILGVGCPSDMHNNPNNYELPRAIGQPMLGNLHTVGHTIQGGTADQWRQLQLIQPANMQSASPVPPATSSRAGSGPRLNDQFPPPSWEWSINRNLETFCLGECDLCHARALTNRLPWKRQSLRASFPRHCQ